MQTIEQTYTINAPIDRVWWSLTSVEGAEGWGAGPATFNAIEGGEFSYWGGDIHGVNTKIEQNKHLEQDWYGHDNPEEKYFVRFTFEPKNGQTDVHLMYSGRIYDENRDLSDWRDYYFEPIKKLLEQS